MAYPRRKSKNKSIKKEVLIFCEGTETEKIYFNKLKQILKLPTVRIKVKGVGESNQRLLDYAINSSQSTRNADSIWIVYDKDNIKITEIEKTWKRAKEKGVHVAFSNSCFELWLLLHYETIKSDQRYNQETIHKRLGKELKLTEDYVKHKSNVIKINEIVEKYSYAIRNNEILIRSGSVYNKAPYTNVKDLILYLKKVASN